MESESVSMMAIKPPAKADKKAGVDGIHVRLFTESNSENTGLVILTDEVLAVEPSNKLTTTWGKLKSTR